MTEIIIIFKKILSFFQFSRYTTPELAIFQITYQLNASY